jgi:predicted ATPase
MTFRNSPKINPKVLAYHYQEAGNHQLAIRRWFESGQGALAHSANVEAIASFRKALQLLDALPETPERIKQEIDIQLALGIPLIAVQGYASAETRAAFSRARRFESFRARHLTSLQRYYSTKSIGTHERQATLSTFWGTFWVTKTEARQKEWA